jgi:hypothetical protein
MINAGKAIKLWHGALTAKTIAARCGFETERGLQLFWQRMKGNGRLPQAERPHFACKNGAATCEEILPEPESDGRDSVIFTAGGEAIDGTPIGGALGLAVPPGDPLLCALRLVHGEDTWRPLDGMPPQTLQMESAGHLPSRARVAQFAAIRDRYAGALMRIAAPSW